MTDQRSAATGWIAPPADWEEVRARLAGLAEEYARFLAGRDPAAAEATGLPGEEPLPVTGPEALAERADIERRLRRRVSAVEPVRGPGEGADGGLGDGGHGDGGAWDAAPRPVRVLRSHLLERLDTSIEILESGDQGALLNVLASPFQGVRRALRLPGPGARQEEWGRLLERYRAAPGALTGIARSLEASAARGVLPPRSQIEAVARQIDRFAGDTAAREAGSGPAAGHVAPDDGAPADSALDRDLRAAADGALDRDLRAAADRTARAASGLSRYLREKLAPRAGAREGVGPERHARWVHRLLGTSIEPAEVYRWAHEELGAVVAAQDALAADVLGQGAGAADLDARLRRDPATGIRPEDFPRWAQDVAEEAWEAVVGRLLDVPGELGRPVVLLEAPGGGVHYEEPDPARGLPGRMLRSFAAGDETVWPWAERTTVLHESVPGHHAHSGAQSVDERLTPWQRHLARVPGCNEGWALYAEALAVETGLVSEPADRFGWLAARRWRLARVLIDLGVHAWLPVPGEIAALPGASGRGEWDRPTAEAVLRAHTVLGEGFVQLEVDKQLGWPAQGLSYVLGERVWLEGRERARRRAASAGEDLDLRAFHNRGIALGSVGLDLLARGLA